MNKKMLTGFFCFGIYFVLYIISILVLQLQISFLLPAIGALCVSALLIILCRTKKYKIAHYLLMSFVFFSWAAAKIIWIYYSNTGLTVQHNITFRLMFAVPNIFLVTTVIALAAFRRKKLNMLQFFFDILTITSMGLILIWIFFFHKEFQNLMSMNANTLITFLKTLMDLFVIGALFIWFASLQKKQRTASTWVFCFGALFYAMSDVVFSYLSFQNRFVLSLSVDRIYAAGLLIMALSGLIEYIKPTVNEEITEEATEIKSVCAQRVFLFLGPVLVILADRDADLLEILFVVFMPAAYMVISHFIQSASKSKSMLESQSYMSSVLEDCVTERSAELIKSMKDISVMSRQDALTKLSNQKHFESKLADMLKQAKDRKIELYMINLDKFKAINIIYGYDIGDAVLAEIAERLRIWGEEDMVPARLRGDDFMLAVYAEDGDKDTGSLACEILQQLSEPVAVPPYQFYTTASIGVSVFPEDGKDVPTLMKNAGDALRYAKCTGTERYMFYRRMIKEKAAVLSGIEKGMKKSACKDSLFYYRSIYGLPKEQFFGVFVQICANEATVDKDAFLEHGEETVLHAMRQVCKWNLNSTTKMVLGLDVTFKQLNNLSFIETFKSLIELSDICAEWLELRIVGNFTVKENMKVLEVFKQSTGVEPALYIDSLESGYYALSYIRRLPVSRLIIASPLTACLTGQTGDAYAVKAILAIANEMNLSITAEGTQETAQMDILKNMGCSFLYGKLSERLIPVVDIMDLYQEA